MTNEKSSWCECPKTLYCLLDSSRNRITCMLSPILLAGLGLCQSCCGSGWRCSSDRSRWARAGVESPNINGFIVQWPLESSMQRKCRFDGRGAAGAAIGTILVLPSRLAFIREQLPAQATREPLDKNWSEAYSRKMPMAIPTQWPHRVDSSSPKMSAVAVRHPSLLTPPATP